MIKCDTKGRMTLDDVLQILDEINVSEKEIAPPVPPGENKFDTRKDIGLFTVSFGNAKTHRHGRFDVKFEERLL